VVAEGIKIQFVATRLILRTWSAAVLRPYKTLPIRYAGLALLHRLRPYIRLPGHSQFELHAIVCDFKAGIHDRAVFRSAVVQDRIGVVDVDQHAATIRIARKDLE
jgi:hypothetical protein